MKLKPIANSEGHHIGWRHWCPGCKWMHVIYTDPKAQANGHFWRFNGDQQAPTFEPSVHLVGQCHYFVRGGRIEYCGDSKHELAGRTVDMLDLEDSDVEREWSA